jgi:hypothetical protein
VRVAADVLEHLLRASEWPLGIHYAPARLPHVSFTLSDYYIRRRHATIARRYLSPCGNLRIVSVATSQVTHRCMPDDARPHEVPSDLPSVSR